MGQMSGQAHRPGQIGRQFLERASGTLTAQHCRIHPASDQPESVEQLVQSGAGLRKGPLGVLDVRFATGEQILDLGDVAAQGSESGGCHLGELADQALALDLPCPGQPLPGRLELSGQLIGSLHPVFQL